MQSELEKTQLEIAKLQLARERHKLEQIQQRHKLMGGLGNGAAVVGGAALKGGSAVLRYVGRYLGWTAELALIVCGVYLFCAYNLVRPHMTFAQRLDYLLDLPGSWGAFLVFVVPVFAAARLHPLGDDKWATAVRLVPLFVFAGYLVVGAEIAR